MIGSISIVTPCFNAERYIERTISSVLAQSAIVAGDIELEYIIVDGNSSDGTVNIVRALGEDRITVISEPDAGMYDALAKGLERASGDVVAYINAGDLYFEHAFQVVADIFSRHSVDWLTGLKTLINDREEVIGCYRPFRYRRTLIAAGCYGTSLPFVQQESTFWRRSALQAVDMDRLRGYRLAGDAFLWHSFASAGIELAVVNSLLGAFRKHEGQLSSQRDSYLTEMRSISVPGTADRLLALWERLLWPMPWRLKERMGAGQFVFNLESQSWERGPA